MGVAEESTVLSSWKDIARYLGKGVRTVQRWEQHLGLPVRRPVGASQKSAVLLHREDVDAWLVTRFAARKPELSIPVKTFEASPAARAELRKNLRTAQELHSIHSELAQQVVEATRLLSERCGSLTTLSIQTSWRSSPLAPECLPVSGSVTSEVA